MRNLEITPIKYDKPFRQVLFEDYKSIGKELPITGGWGYTREDAIVIDKNDPVAALWQPFNGVSLEYFIAQKRIYEELIIFREQGDKFSQIKINLKRQACMGFDEGKTYDYLIFDVTAFHDKDFEKIDKYVKEQLAQEKDFDFVKYFESKSDLRYHYMPEFWFEISSFAP